ncbi:MAG: signal peptidase I [Candidatus Roizmanbacteria bacterium]|nr:signal peptidase I [Candidatus Roizmanbacteria bacterium]
MKRFYKQNTKLFLIDLPLNFVFTTEVTTPSMEPVLPVGSQVKVKKDIIQQTHEGDVIMFINDNYSHPVVHRIIKKIKMGSEILLATKGDNAQSMDSYFVEQKNFIGVVIQKLNDRGIYEDLNKPVIFLLPNWIRYIFNFFSTIQV